MLNKLNLFKYLLKMSHHVLFLFVLGIIYMSFSDDNLIYIGLLIGATGYLIKTCIDYSKILNDQCPWELKAISDNYRVALLQNRISLISSIAIIAASISFIIFLIFSNLISHDVLLDIVYRSTHKTIFGCEVIGSSIYNTLNTTDLVYAFGFIKTMMIYGVLEKIQQCKLLMSISLRRPYTLSHFTIDKRCLLDNQLYPIIYLDNAMISPSRYNVSHDETLIGVTIIPPLALMSGTKIELEMVEPNNIDHMVTKGNVCDDHDQIRCAFKCRNVTKRIFNKSQNLNIHSNCLDHI